MRNKKIFNQRGVTLIELLAVIVILGIISAVAVPSVLNQIDKAKTNSDLANLTIINDAIERYAAYNGEYPYVNNNSIVDLRNVLTNNNDSKHNPNGGPYIKSFPDKRSDGTVWTLDIVNSNYVQSVK